MAETYTLTERTYMTADGRACREDDLEAAFLVGPPGLEIPLAEAKRLGLVKEKKAPPNKAAGKAGVKADA